MTGPYGSAVARSFGLDQAPRLVTRSLRREQLAVTRLNFGLERAGMSAPIAPEDTFIMALHLVPMSHHEIWIRDRRVIAQGYDAGSIRLVSLEHGSRAMIASAQDTLSFYLPRRMLDDIANDAGAPPIEHLACPPGLIDPVVHHLGRALLPAFDAPDEAEPLFVDHVAIALNAHLVDRYGGFRSRRLLPRDRLGARHASLAKEILAEHLDHALSLRDVARQIGLSPGHFAQAFRQATGITPHRWRQRCRIARAKELLRTTDRSIAEIAIACGFADQSHLTRVFGKAEHTTPAAWRRGVRA